MFRREILRGFITLKDLTKEGVRVAIANPEMVCVGTYAVEIIEKNLTPEEKAKVQKEYGKLYGKL